MQITMIERKRFNAYEFGTGLALTLGLVAALLA